MQKSLLFLPDISGFTKFVQTTEVEHSQHVIAELLEILIEANTLDLTLAEIEGDALFFYKENFVPTQTALLEQVEHMFTAFYSHLKRLETNRICPCNACASALNLELKIIAHSGELQFITVQGNRKPFGAEVIEAHRLMKNSVKSDNYFLLSKGLAEDINLHASYKDHLFDFDSGKNEYDGREVHYQYAKIDPFGLKLKPFEAVRKLSFDAPPNLTYEKQFPVKATDLLEYITNYSYRHHWNRGVDGFKFKENEVTKIGSEHICVINGKHLDFVAVTKEGEPGQYIYGEMTSSPPPVDEIYQFYIITPLSDTSCNLEIEIYWKAKSPVKKLLLSLVAKRFFQKNLLTVINDLHRYVAGRAVETVAQAG